jgi:hypothetical protein
MFTFIFTSPKRVRTYPGFKGLTVHISMFYHHKLSSELKNCVSQKYHLEDLINLQSLHCNAVQRLESVVWTHISDRCWNGTSLFNPYCSLENIVFCLSYPSRNHSVPTVMKHQHGCCKNVCNKCQIACQMIMLIENARGKCVRLSYTVWYFFEHVRSARSIQQRVATLKVPSDKTFHILISCIKNQETHRWRARGCS